MNWKKLAVASIAVFVLYFLLEWLIHGYILTGAYLATSDIWRPEEEFKMHVSLIKIAVFAFMFVFIYSKGMESKGIMEGVRYGTYIGLLIHIPVAYTYYNVLPIPYSLAWQWWVYGTIQCVACGAVAALLYKKE